MARTTISIANGCTTAPTSRPPTSSGLATWAPRMPTCKPSSPEAISGPFTPTIHSPKPSVFLNRQLIIPASASPWTILVFLPSAFLSAPVVNSFSLNRTATMLRDASYPTSRRPFQPVSSRRHPRLLPPPSRENRSYRYLQRPPLHLRRIRRQRRARGSWLCRRRTSTRRRHRHLPAQLLGVRRRLPRCHSRRRHPDP